MACIKRIQNKPYEIKIDFAFVDKIANQVKKVPLQWINQEGNDITQELIYYILPLIQGEFPVSYQNGIPLHYHIKSLDAKMD